MQRWRNARSKRVHNSMGFIRCSPLRSPNFLSIEQRATKQLCNVVIVGEIHQSNSFMGAKKLYPW
jgi:hypothetical protein